MNRRGFLKALTAAVAGVAAYEADPERLLWVPGAKTIFLPPAKKFEAVPTIVEPDADYLAAVFNDDDYAIDVDMIESSYNRAVAHGATFRGIRRVRVIEGGLNDGRLIREHAGTPLDLTEMNALRDRMHAVDARKATERLDAIEALIKAQPTRRPYGRVVRPTAGVRQTYVSDGDGNYGLIKVED